MNHIGHYRNAITSQDICDWAGVSIGSVINCTNHVIIALLNQHDKFIEIPTEDSEDLEWSQKWVKERSFSSWRTSVFIADGSMINLFEKPSVYTDTFCDRKSQYSPNCQVNKNMPNNMLFDIDTL